MRPHFRLVSLVAILVCLVGTAATADTIAGKVVDISDGDTITVLSEGRKVKVRLKGIDSPESKQQYSKAAKRYVTYVAAGKSVTVHYTNKDQWGRILGDVILPDGASLNQQMVESGYAWHYKRYSKDEELARREDEARANRRGLWQEKDPQAPWEYRKKTRSGRGR